MTCYTSKNLADKDLTMDLGKGEKRGRKRRDLGGGPRGGKSKLRRDMCRVRQFKKMMVGRKNSYMGKRRRE